MAPIRILVVDDEPSIRDLLRIVLEKAGYEIELAENGAVALELFKRNPHNLVITDLRMPVMDGLQLIRHIKRITKETQFMVITGYASKDSAIEALDLGAHAYLVKPFDCVEVIPVMVLKTIEHQRLLNEKRELIDQLQSFLNRKKQEIVSFEEITDMLARIEDQDQLLNQLIGRIARDLKPERTWLWLRQLDRLTLKMVRGASDVSAERLLDLMEGTDAIGRILKRGRVAQVKDLRHIMMPDCAETFLEAGLNTLFLVPILSADRVEGALGLMFHCKRTLADDYLHRMKSFARQLALVLKMIRLYKDLIESNRNLQKAQDLLIQTESLAATGRMAGGIAHELGNPLGIIATTTRYLTENNPPPDELQECLGVIGEKISEMHNIVLDIRELTRPKEYQFETTDLHTVLNKTLRFLRPRISKGNVDLHLDYDGSIPPMSLDSGKMAQVFLNLILNALDAMPHGGELRIITRKTSTDNEVTIVFEDTGCGIPIDDIETIFTPFYSRKIAGTGLGLPISRQIINRHNGVLYAQNLPDRGARFTIRQPIAVKARIDLPVSHCIATVMGDSYHE